MSIHRKKSAVINSQVRISNELSQVFVPTNNLGISINTTVPVNSTNTIATTNTINITNINWQNAVGLSSNTNNWLSVCWSPELKLFCAVAYNGTNRVMVSNNGINWSNATSGVIANPWISVCWSPELKLFCAVANNNSGNPNESIMLSTDGINWKNATYSQGINYTSVCWSPELKKFLAVGLNKGSYTSSSNGYTWTNRLETFSELYNLAAVCWSPELNLFCAVANGKTATITSSFTKKSENILPTGLTLNGVCWSPELRLFCAVGINSIVANNNIVLSSDGINWSYARSGVPSSISVWSSVCWVSELGVFCAVSSTINKRNTDLIIISKNGYDWYNNNTGVGLAGCNSVCWSPELMRFCAIGSEANSASQRFFISDPLLYINPTKYIGLISSTNGNQGINTSTNLLYNINYDKLQLNNLSTTNPPMCSAIPVNSNDLINRAYLNSFVGDYTQGWIYDDWITGDASGSLNWVIDSSNNTSMLSSDASGHIGIIKLTRTFQNFTSLKPNNSITFDSTTNIRVRFLIRPFSNSSVEYTQIRLLLSAYLGNVDYSANSANSANMASWVFDTSGVAVGTVSANTKWQCMVNSNTPDAYYTYGLSENSLRNKWVLFEIELNNQKPSFYITVIGETNRTLVYQENTKTIATNVLLVPHIILQAGSVSSTTTFDVDYIDIKYNNMTRA